MNINGAARHSLPRGDCTHEWNAIRKRYQRRLLRGGRRGRVVSSSNVPARSYRTSTVCPRLRRNAASILQLPNTVIIEPPQSSQNFITTLERLHVSHHRHSLRCMHTVARRQAICLAGPLAGARRSRHIFRTDYRQSPMASDSSRKRK